LVVDPGIKLPIRVMLTWSPVYTGPDALDCFTFRTGQKRDANTK
jgi:hypothetical protein